MHLGTPLLVRALAAVTLASLALASAGCSRFTSSGDDKGAGPPPPVVTAPPAPVTTVFNVNVPAQDSPKLLLKRVTVETTYTKLDFTYENTGPRANTISLAPAGDAEAMFIELPGGQKVAFQSATGIATKPTRDKVAPGASQSFSMTFDPLPKGTQTFDLYEGEAAKKVMPGKSTFWIFRKIELK